MQNFVLTKHAMERCQQRGFDYREVQRGRVRTAVVNYDGFEPVVLTVLPPEAWPKMAASRHVKHKRRARQRAAIQRIADLWALLSIRMLDAHVPASWEDRA